MHLYFISTIVTITVTQINKALHIPRIHRHFTFPASVTKSLLLDPGKKFVSQYMKQFFFLVTGVSFQSKNKTKQKKLMNSFERV